MSTDDLSILRCPNTGQRLIRLNENCVASEDGRYRYDVINGIYILLPERFGTDYRQRMVAEFYATKGWSRNIAGLYVDTAAFVDGRRVSRDFTGACIRAIRRHLPKDGKWLLDAGSGPIPHTEYLNLQNGFDRRLCVDFSLDALSQAKEKLGDRGAYVVGDLTQLPIADDSVDAAISFHVIYHIAEELQAAAFREVSRVTKEGGTAAIVYRWAYSPISWRLDRIFAWLDRIIPRNTRSPDTENLSKPNAPSLYFHAHSLQWFMGQRWPFSYSIFPFRVIDNEIMRRHFTDHPLWKCVTRTISIWQRMMPRFTGSHGEYPCIVIRKSENHNIRKSENHNA